MEPNAYDPLPDIKRYIFNLFASALKILENNRFGDEDKIDSDQWAEAVREKKDIIENETIDRRLFPYLGRLHFVVMKLRDAIEGQHVHLLKRKYWLERLDEQSLAAFPELGIVRKFADAYIENSKKPAGPGGRG